MIKGNLFYGQSGGPSPVINASAYGVLSEALQSDNIHKVYALRHGIDGVLKENFVDASTIENLELLLNTPSSAFGSVRFKLASHIDDPEIYKIIHHVFKKYNIRYFIYNGGNDSMDTVLKLSAYFDETDYEIYINGVPKTVDNDLPNTDHTPGFASSAKYIINTLMTVKCDSTVYPEGKVTIVEIMGRHAGWLTASAHVCKNEGFGPDLIYLPEIPFDMTKFIEDVSTIYNKNRNCLIAVSEGIKDIDHNFIGAMNSQIDAFGHKQLGGVAVFLGELIEEKLGLNYRAIELNTPQRAAAFIRSDVDVNEAVEVGRHAVQFSLKGNTGQMITINRVSNKPYKVTYGLIPVGTVANKEKVIPASMLSGEQDVTSDFYDYIMPLIKGTYPTQYKNGVVELFKLKK